MGVLDHRPVSIAVAPLGCGAGGYIVARTRAVHDQWQGEPSPSVDVDRGAHGHSHRAHDAEAQ